MTKPSTSIKFSSIEDAELTTSSSLSDSTSLHMFSSDLLVSETDWHIKCRQGFFLFVFSALSFRSEFYFLFSSCKNILLRCGVSVKIRVWRTLLFFVALFLFLKTWENGWISFGEIYGLSVTFTLVASTSEMLNEDTILEFTSEPITWLDDCEANAIE